MCFAQTDFPRQTGIFNGSKRRRPGSTVVPAYGDYIRARFRNTRGDNPNARAGDQLHSNSRVGIHGAQIMNQLRQVLDTVNVMVWWW